MIQNKKDLRAYFKSVAPARRAEKDGAIYNTITALPEYVRAKVVYAFISVGSEPSTKEIINKAFEDGKRVFVPVITGGEMLFSEIYPVTVFVTRGFGLWEPETLIFSDAEPDIVIVPMVGYDSYKGRLGHGKGYYDRFLKGKNVFKAGICYTDFRAESVFASSNDIPMDIIITEDGIIR